MGTLSWTEVVIAGLVPLGQLWARIFRFNGSLDKWYFMFPLFLIPPFSFIPLIMMKYGFVNDGPGKNPLDYNILIPLIGRIFIILALPLIINKKSKKLIFTIGIILQLIITMVANLYRRKENCNDITINSMGKATIDSTIALGMGELIPMMVPWIPIFGLIIKLLSTIPVIGPVIKQLLWGVGFAGGYIVMNMFNQDNMNAFCNSPLIGLDNDKKPLLVAVISIVISFIFS